ncbi:hypothetical protein C8J48_2313 [Desmospora activa DSM 45169]|uniref:Uncharacterized protein n=1 Tax=Desmospora activa DSM 45169 TaxID=1121389 RepID=A0A2T4ZCS7_9BACL|nr:hypothetical protein C8J48_2313 [Desmospora activa DSM 45169]
MPKKGDRTVEKPIGNQSESNLSPYETKSKQGNDPTEQTSSDKKRNT